MLKEVFPGDQGFSSTINTGWRELAQKYPASWRQHMDRLTEIVRQKIYPPILS